MTELTEIVRKTLLIIHKFDPRYTDWNRWLNYFEFAINKFLVPDEEKVQFLLHMIEPVAFYMLRNKLETNPLDVPYDVIISTLQASFDSMPKAYAARYRFYHRNQIDGETAREYALVLSKLSIQCDLGYNRNTSILERFLCGLRSKEIRDYLREIDSLDMNKAVFIAQKMEITELLHKGII